MGARVQRRRGTYERAYEEGRGGEERVGAERRGDKGGGGSVSHTREKLYARKVEGARA